MLNPPLCPHCPKGAGIKYPLFEDEKFLIVCDAHPLIQGHILIIPKEHVSCTGALCEKDFERFKRLYYYVETFISETYGSCAVFEHGLRGQTVFHAHTHFLPFGGGLMDIIAEKNVMKKIDSLDVVRSVFEEDGRYLYLAMGKKKWLINTDIGYPRFFRDKFAVALKNEERGDWEGSERNDFLMGVFRGDIEDLREKWGEWVVG